MPSPFRRGHSSTFLNMASNSLPRIEIAELCELRYCLMPAEPAALSSLRQNCHRSGKLSSLIEIWSALTAQHYGSNDCIAIFFIALLDKIEFMEAI
jgi:hypothetical protein